MQNLPHGELAQYMNLKKTLPVNEIKFIAANIILCLEFIHSQGIIHRDLKPENLVFNDKNKLTLIDFGTADVQLIKGVNDELYVKYIECRKKYCKPKNIDDLDDDYPKKSG